MKNKHDKICVLVVEDEFLIRMGIVDYLQDAGFEVFEAENSDIALLILNSNDRIQIIFTDVDMPGSMDGLKLSAAVRNRWPPVKIIVTSGHRRVGLEDIPEDSLFYGKPYDYDQIAASFRQMMNL